MENLTWQQSQIQDGIVTSMALDADKSLYMIAATDIGAFAALAFEFPDAHIGKPLENAGDELTEAQIAERFAAAIGRPVQLVSAEGPPAFPNLVKMYTWFNQTGYEADIPALRINYPALLSFKAWIQGSNWTSN